MTALSTASIVQDAEHAALIAACEPGVALCTIIGIDGSFSRRIGAQLAVHPDGTTTGSLSDGCLENQLASDACESRAPIIRRYGRGSPVIDFRLPCGGGLAILIDPAPDRDACRAVVASLKQRHAAALVLPENTLMAKRLFIPSMQMKAIGVEPELAVFSAVAGAAGIQTDIANAASRLSASDPWTAIVLLFHDHEQERILLAQALQSHAFYIGAQGGEAARSARVMDLLSDGIAEEEIARIRGPIGSVPACRSPGSLALSVLSEIVGEYEKLQPRH